MGQEAETIRQKFGPLIRKIREERMGEAKRKGKRNNKGQLRWSQRDVAKEIGINSTRYGKVEDGEEIFESWHMNNWQKLFELPPEQRQAVQHAYALAIADLDSDVSLDVGADTALERKAQSPEERLRSVTLLPSPRGKNLIKRLLDAPHPRANERTHPLLVGAVVSVLKEWELLIQYPELVHTWDFEKLLRDLKRMIIKDRYVDFGHTKNFAQWAMGFFRNKAEENLAIVLEDCITKGLIALKQHVKRAEHPEETTPRTIQEQLIMLQHLATNSQRHTRIGEQCGDVIKGFEHYCTREDAAREIQRIVDHAAHAFAQDRPLETMYDLVLTSEAEATSIVWWRAQGERISARGGMCYAVELVITAKAVIWTGEFRRILLKECGQDFLSRWGSGRSTR